jgi:hypothetical protein
MNSCVFLRIMYCALSAVRYSHFIARFFSYLFFFSVFLGGCRLHLSGFGQDTLAGCCEHGNEPSGFIKGG